MFICEQSVVGVLATYCYLTFCFLRLLLLSLLSGAHACLSSNAPRVPGDCVVLCPDWLGCDQVLGSIYVWFLGTLLEALTCFNPEVIYRERFTRSVYLFQCVSLNCDGFVGYWRVVFTWTSCCSNQTWNKTSTTRILWTKNCGDTLDLFVMPCPFGSSVLGTLCAPTLVFPPHNHFLRLLFRWVFIYPSTVASTA